MLGRKSFRKGKAKMPKLTKTEIEAFNKVGAAICDAKDCAAEKKALMPSLAEAIEKNRKALIEGVTIGDYLFKLVIRGELTAVKVKK